MSESAAEYISCNAQYLWQIGRWTNTNMWTLLFLCGVLITHQVQGTFHSFLIMLFFFFGFSSKFVILSFDIFNNICKLMACRCCICSLKLMLSLCHYPSGVDRGDAARYWWTTADYWETSGDYWETTPGYSGKRKDIWYCLCLS